MQDLAQSHGFELLDHTVELADSVSSVVASKKENSNAKLGAVRDPTGGLPLLCCLLPRARHLLDRTLRAHGNLQVGDELQTFRRPRKMG
jgi:hypothetical protein